MRAIALLLLFACAPSAAAQTYRERYRPQFHFTPAENWMNDPNGMVFHDGEWHLFYQYNPFGDRWGHMSWGHAVSRDLVRWEHLPVALAEADDIMIFSGSAVVDRHNTSGFGAGGRPPLVAIYTGHHAGRQRQDQRIAYSNDRGRTWTKWEGNPVLDIRAADFRDPKVFWHAGSGQWVMAVAHPLDRQVGFYGSPDLKHWRPLSTFGPAGSTEGIWECPDLFPLAVDDGGGAQKWCLVVNVGSGAPAGGSGCQYFVGGFDGREFVADARTHPRLAAETTVPEGEVFADFEAGYGGWIATGEAFGDAPARGALEGQMAVEGFLGGALVNSFHGGDASTGTLTSPEFEIAAPSIHFLIGGGAHEGRTCMNLLVGGEVVRTATGDEAERPAWHGWDVGELRGRRAQLQIVDAAEGSWGHVNIDHIVFGAAAAASRPERALWADFGADFYAAVSWSDVPEEDGRRIWIGWMSNWTYAQDLPTAPWRSAMTVPRALSLRDTPAGFRLVQRPVRELGSLQEAPATFAGGTLAEANAWLAARAGAALIDLALRFDGVGADTEFGLRVHGAGGGVLELRHRDDGLALDRTRAGEGGFHERFPAVHTAPCPAAPDGVLELRLLLDTSSIEVFAGGGTVVLSDRFFPAPGDYRLELFRSGDRPAPGVGSAIFAELNPIW